MRKTITAKKFVKDLRRCKKRGYDIDRISEIIDLLRNDQPLPESCRPHKLAGNYTNLWECHIAPDWLLIYDLLDEENAIKFERTGTHSDLFR